MSQSTHELYAAAAQAKARGDYARAFEIYEDMAKNGHVYSLVLLGAMYAEGQGTEMDISKAEELFDRAAALGVPEAILQKAYIWDRRGDMSRHFFSIQQAVRAGLLPAQYRLGLCYARGHGTDRDAEKALEVMREAAARGHIGAQWYVALRLLARPYKPFDFLRGLVLLPTTIVKGFVIAFRNPKDDRVR